MSIIRCTDCMRFIDTDYESEFYTWNSEKPICEECLVRNHPEELESTRLEREMKNDGELCQKCGILIKNPSGKPTTCEDCINEQN